MIYHGFVFKWGDFLIFKKPFALILCFTILFSSVISVAAVTPGTILDGVGIVCTFWDIVNFTHDQFLEDNPGASLEDFNGFGGGNFSGNSDHGGGFTADWYQDYVNKLNDDLGTTTLIDGGVRFLYPVSKYGTSSGVTISSRGSVGSTDIAAVFRSYEADKGVSLTFNSDPVVAPFSGYVTCGYSFSMSRCFVSDNRTFKNNYPVNKGVEVSPTGGSPDLWIYPVDTTGDFASFSGYVYADFFSYAGENLPTTQDISINSRPTSFTGDYGIIGDDGSITKIDGSFIVDESSSLVYNPITNSTLTFTEYVYDYSDRSYNLTLEDGSTMKVTYGDENITINEGDTVYNVYYLTENPGDGGAGAGDGSDDGSGLGDAVGGFIGALGDVLAGIISGLLSLATKALEALVGLGDLLKQMGEALMGFFGGFTDFLGAVFPFLPEETFTILNLGLILMIAAAVFKKFF